MNRLLKSFLSAAVVFAAVARAADKPRPKIIFILSDDIGESKNPAGEMPGKAKELQAKMVAWRE